MRALSLLTASFSFSLAQSATAGVVDHFQCSIELHDTAGKVGPHASQGATLARTPLTANPQWLSGTTATASDYALSLTDPASGLRIDLTLGYQQFLVPNPPHAAVFSCENLNYTYSDGTTSGYGCPTAADPQDGSIYDPTQTREPTTITPAGYPAFVPTDVYVATMGLPSGQWASVVAGCSFVASEVISP